MADFTLPEPLKDQAQTAAPQFTLPTPATHTLTDNEKSAGIFEAIQQMSDPEEGRARLIVAKHIADRLGVTTSEVFRDIDNYTQKYYKETRPAKDFLQVVKDEGRTQWATMQISNLWVKHSQARSQEEADKIFEQIEVAKQSLPSHDEILSFAPAEWVRQGYGLLAQMASSTLTGADYGVATALGVTAIGAAVGVPVGLATAIKIIMAAHTAGSAGKMEYGGSYGDMVEKGISTDIARKYSAPVGVINGMLEAGEFLTFVAGVPAVGKLLEKAAKKTMENVFLSKILTNRAVKFVASHTIAAIPEVLQEDVQEVNSIVWEHLATEFENEAHNNNIPDLTIQDVKDRLKEITRVSALGFTALSVAGAPFRAGVNSIRKGKSSKQSSKMEPTTKSTTEVTTEVTTEAQAQTKETTEAELDTLLAALETNPADKDLNAKRIQLSDELDAMEETKPIEIQEPTPMRNLTGDDWLTKKRMEAENSLDAEADWTPSEVLRYKVLDSFQGVDESNVDAITSFVDLVAKNQGMTGDQFLSKNFTPEIITKDKAEGSIAQGENRGGMSFINEETGEATSPLDWANLKISKALMHVGPGSDVSTFFHEFTHAVVGVGLTDSQRGILETAYQKPLQEFTVADLEDVATKAEEYFASGESPTPELRSLYEKIRDMITRFIARLQGQISPELKAFYDSLVASKPMTLMQGNENKQLKSATGNTGTFDPNNPSILYQPGDSELVRKAVEQNEWVDDELLSRFASEEWASDEIKKRAMDRRTAGEYEDMDEFIRDSIALSIDPTNDEILYYAQLWKTRDLATDTIPASREEQNKNFVDSLDKPGLETLLSMLASENDIADVFKAFDHGLISSAIKTVMKGGHISDAHYKKLMDQVKYNPTSFRETVYSLLPEGDEYRAFMEEVSTDPTLAELEKRKRQLSDLGKEIDKKNTTIESATQEIERAKFYIQNLEKKTFALEDALSSAQQEAAKGEKSVAAPYINALSSAKAESRMAVSRAKSEKAKEIRNFYRVREAMQKMIRVIMAHPTKSMNYEYQKRLLDLQSGYTKGLGKRGTEARLDMLKREISPEIRAELEKELAAINVKKMSFEQLEDLADMVKGIRQAGIDAQKLNLLNWRLMLGENWSKILETLKPFMKEAVFGKTSKTGKKQTKSTIGKLIQFATLTPERIAELLDGGKDGIFHKLLIEEVNGVTDDADTMIKQRLAKVQEAMKKYGINAWKLGRVEKIAGYDYTRHQIMGFYIQNQNVDSRKALLDGDNLTEQDVYSLIQTLTNEERAFADELMDIVGNDQEFQRLEIAVGENRNELMQQVEKYFPMLRLNMEGTGSMDTQVVGEMVDRSGKGRPGVRFGGRISRVKVGKKNQTPIRHDVINVAVQQIIAQEKYIAMQGQVKKLAAIFNNNEVRKALVSAYGDKAPQWITKYLNDLAIPNFYNDQISRTSKMLRSNAAVAYLAFNALTVLKQLPSLAFYLADAGPVAMISATGEFLARPIQTVKLVRSLDPQMASRSFDRVMEELKTMDKSGYEMAIKKIGQWGMAGIMMMDTIATTIGWKAVYNKEMSIHADPAKAMRKAQEVTMRTQPSSRVQNLAEIYRSNEGLNWILMFTNQLNKIYNIASWDIPQAFRHKEIGKAFTYMGAIAISGMAMGMIARKDIPDEPEDAKQAALDIGAQLLASIPVVGGNIVAGTTGWRSTGVDPFPVFAQLGATGKTLVDADKDMEQKLESTLKLVLEGFVLTGIPQIATKRSIKAFFDDTWDLQFDPWELIGGHPEE